MIKLLAAFALRLLGLPGIASGVWLMLHANWLGVLLFVLGVVLYGIGAALEEGVL